MKKITLLAVLFAAFAMNAQTNLYFEDFEAYTPSDNVGEDTDIPTDFLSYDVDGDGYNWGLSNPVNYTQPFADIYLGNNFIASASYITAGDGGNGGQGALSPNNILVLPMINIPSGASGVDFSYFVGSGTDPDFFSETYSVTVTNTSDEADILAATPVYTTTLAFQGGEYNTINLDAFVGEDIYIAFRHHDTSDQWLIGLDDLSVDAAVLSVGDNHFEGFTYFVNANELNLRANLPMDSVQLYNVLGQEVISQRLSNTNETVNISALQSGIYIANVSIDGASKTVKIVKK